MGRGEVEHVKALLSRRSDRARLSYDRIPSEVARQCIIIGTTNSEEYLKDMTGNRRFWPVRVKRFDPSALKRDLAQLWGEAAAAEAAGESIRLDPKLYPAASAEQAQRLTNDPYFEILQNYLGDRNGKISSADVWEILGGTAAQRSQDQNSRMGSAMRLLGWKRPNTAGTIKIDGKNVMGYVRGP
jgi:predicted P-loop ATPase